MLAKMILLESNFFELAETYVNLSHDFLIDFSLHMLTNLFDMVLYPLYLFYKLMFHHETPSMFNMITIYRIIKMWYNYFKYYFLNSDIVEWVTIVRSIDGPFISTNDPTYHVYVYADGMERIKRMYSL